MRTVHTLFASLIVIACLTQSTLANPPLIKKGALFDGVLPVAAGRTTLTVAGGGIWDRTVYNAGEQPALSGLMSDGNVLPDGRYKFEFRSVEPAGGVHGSEGKNVNDGVKSPPQVNQNLISGYFTVSGGQVIISQ